MNVLCVMHRAFCFQQCSGFEHAHKQQMPIGLRHNSVAMSTANHLNASAVAMSRTLNKVSSGTRIDQIGEDAAGAAVSIKLSVRAQSSSQAVRNANDAVSLLQTSQAALNESGNMLIRLRELATQSASETLHRDERKYIVNEAKQIESEMARLALSAEFNGLAIGSGNSYTAQVGTDGDENHQISITAADIKTIHTTISTLNLSSGELAQLSLRRIDRATDIMNKQQAKLGAVHNRLLNAISNEQASSFNHLAAASRITDADMARETSTMTALQVKHAAGTAAMGQANSISQSILSLI